MPDRRQPDSSTDDNPFAAPPEGRPDQRAARAAATTRAPGPAGRRAGTRRTPSSGEPGTRCSPACGGSSSGSSGSRRWDCCWGRSRCTGGSAGVAGTAARGGLAALGPAAGPQRAAAVSGLITATLAIVLALGSYGVQLAYKDFYICRDDALTRAGQLECNELLPDNLLGAFLKVRQ